MEQNIIDAIETKLGYEFKDKALLIQAFTRESYAKEQRVKGLDVQSNEQLEYFGDSVLNYLVVCGQLDNFTKVMEGTGLHVLYKEGKLSEFNSHWTDKTMLSQCIDALGFAQYLIMSKGDINQKANENKSVKEDLFESLVGAMWIDSDKDISRIQNVVYSMLNIQFESADVEKNYYSQFMEFVDKYKAKYTKELHELSEGYEIELGIDINTFYGQKGVCMWSRYGYGRNIKEAEQDAARNLFSLLEEYGLFDMNNVLPARNYNLETAVNFLQELSQKGYIGEITYEDELCFSEEKKPYWKVKCSIANYVINFFGCDESKKKAKKKAAMDALIFTYENYNKKDANPQNKVFKFVLNETSDSDEMKVLVINSINDIVARGTVYPDNKEYDLYLTSDYVDMNDDDRWRAYDNPEEFLLEWIATNPNTPDELLDGSEISYYIHAEYTKLPEEVKNNGVLLREAFLKITSKYLEK